LAKKYASLGKIVLCAMMTIAFLNFNKFRRMTEAGGFTSVCFSLGLLKELRRIIWRKVLHRFVKILQSQS